MLSGTIGDYLRDLRLSRRISLRDLARLAGVNASTLSRWEAGVTCPSNHELTAVLRALKASDRESEEAWERLRAPRALSHAKQQAPFPMPLHGDLWRAMRLRKGWTLEQTASALGVTCATLSRWERSERVPPLEDRIRLGQLLDATPAEMETLCQEDQGTLPLFTVRPTTLAEIRDAIAERFVPSGPEQPLYDLYFLSLEAFLIRLLRRSMPVETLLTGVYALHSHVLTNRGRLIEAQAPACCALWWMERLPKLEPVWLDAIHVIAKGAAETRSRFTPQAGIQILIRWLPIAREISLTHEQWFRRDIAEYQSYLRPYSFTKSPCQELLPDLREALQAGDPNPVLTQALVLTNGGRPNEALELLESTPELCWENIELPLPKLNFSLVWVRTLECAGCAEAAQDWRQRAHEVIQQSHIWQTRALLKLLGVQEVVAPELGEDSRPQRQEPHQDHQSAFHRALPPSGTRAGD